MSTVDGRRENVTFTRPSTVEDHPFQDYVAFHAANEAIAWENDPTKGLWTSSADIVGVTRLLNKEASKWPDGFLRAYESANPPQSWETARCAVWGSHAQSKGVLPPFDYPRPVVADAVLLDDRTNLFGKRWYSPRTACHYGVPESAAFDVCARLEEASSRQRAQITTALLDKAEAGAHDRHAEEPNCAILDVKTIEEAVGRSPLRVDTRLRRLMKTIAEQTDRDCGVGINPYSNPLNTGAWIARSESRGYREVEGLLGQLEADGLIVRTAPGTVTLTVKGLRGVEDASGADEDEIFVAMWFTKETEKVRAIIKKGVEQAGYRPVIADEQHHNGRVDDWIVQRVQQARAVVADLTAPPGAQRPNVYFEMGIAEGSGKQVIVTAPRRVSRDIGLDVAMLHRIEYETDADGTPCEGPKLVARIEQRLTRTLGRGPRIAP